MAGCILTDLLFSLKTQAPE